MRRNSPYVVSEKHERTSYFRKRHLQRVVGIERCNAVFVSEREFVRADLENYRAVFKALLHFRRLAVQEDFAVLRHAEPVCGDCRSRGIGRAPGVVVVPIAAVIVAVAVVFFGNERNLRLVVTDKSVVQNENFRACDESEIIYRYRIFARSESIDFARDQIIGHGNAFAISRDVKQIFRVNRRFRKHHFVFCGNDDVRFYKDAVRYFDRIFVHAVDVNFKRYFLLSN